VNFPDRYDDPFKIGQGGMGEIFRAADTVLGRDVAIKVLFPHVAADPELRARFTREALAAARLSGEAHVVAIYDVGEAEGRPFIVMEYMPGGSIADRLAAGRPAEAEALCWLDEIARALDAAHARGIVHRDVKPANMLLDGAGHVHVADFGIASATGLDSHTQTGVVLGTAGYLSPEQASGQRATPASDVYSLGVVARELLGPSAATDRATAREPEDRYATAGALAAALRDAEPPTVVMRRRSRRPALAVAVALVVAGGLAAALLAATIGAGSPTPTPTVKVVTVPSPLETTTLVVTTTQIVQQDKHGHDHGKKKEKRD
jgi:serine/threonine-protein kinase